MNKKRLYRNSIILSLIAVFLVAVFLLSNKTYADDPETISTTVSVNNAAPSYTVSPFETETYTGSNNASSTTTPTNQGANVTFRATGDDPDGNNYYLAICKTDAITANDNAVPTCTGGNWCISSSTADASQASCNYSPVVGDSENNDWYAFICDHSSGSKCSASSQGSGDSGSPFIVNHVPTLTSVADATDPYDPGATISFTSVASDSDTYGSTDDDLTLLICSTSYAIQTTPYATPSCVATQLALSSAPATTDPSASYNIPSVYQDGTYTAHAFVYDSHNLLHVGVATTQKATSVNTAWTVNNIAPTTTITTPPSATLTLTENTTTALTSVITMTDTNSCLDITTGGSVISDFFNDATKTHANCDQSAESDGDDCYAQVSCTVNSGVDSCSGATDSTVAYTCTTNVQYYAESTDGALSQYPSNYWDYYVIGTDDDGSSNTASYLDTLEVSTLLAFSAEDAITYGNLDAGTISDNKTVLVTSTGNTIVDTYARGTNMTSGSNTIVVTKQKYSTASFDYATEGISLTTSDAEIELNVPKTYWNTSLYTGTANTYWRLEVPAGTPSGTYSGTNTLTAVQGEW